MATPASTSRAGLRNRRMVRALLAGVMGATVFGGLLAGCSPTPAPTPLASADASGGPAPTGGTGVVLAADKVQLSSDGRIDEAGLAHDSRDDAYRTPFGSVPAGSEITLRLRATAGDLTGATVRVWDAVQEIQALIPMEIVASDRTAGDHGVDWWQTTLRTPATPTVLWYRFIVSDGPTTRYLEDDAAADGGSGEVYAESPDLSWQIVLHEPGFETPDWTHGAVGLPDLPGPLQRRRPVQQSHARRGAGHRGRSPLRLRRRLRQRRPRQGMGRPARGRLPRVAGRRVHRDPVGRDFFGGDLAGVTAKLDDLQALGVTVLYMNPIFAAPSNHRYDTSSYEFIDPDLGTREDLEALVAAAGRAASASSLDGVFNHVSSNSPWFDRSRRFEETGACEAAASDYRPGSPSASPSPTSRPRAPRPAGRRRHLLRRLVRLRHHPRAGGAGRCLRPVHRRRRRRGPVDRRGRGRLAPRRHGQPLARLHAQDPRCRQGRRSRGLRARREVGRRVDVPPGRPGRQRHELPLPAGGHRARQRRHRRPRRGDRGPDPHAVHRGRCARSRRTTQTPVWAPVS